MNKKPLYLTCALCHHFDSNRESCTLKNIDTFAVNTGMANTCQKQGDFIRNIHVQYSISNYYQEGDHIPSAFIEDFSHLPVDAEGRPLFVITKRGYERAIPAYVGLELTSDFLLGVKREFTYQGQREIIYEYGVELAKKVCKALKIDLVVLPEEEGWEGIEEFKMFSTIYH